MRHIAVAALIVACLAGTALAQDAQPAEPNASATTVPVQLNYLRRPNARAFAVNYPRRALHDGIAGTAVMCCTILSDGHLDCTAPFEWPTGYGFGEATLRIAPDFVIADAETLAGGRIRNQVIWMMGESTPELDAVLTRVRQGTRDICGPTINGVR